MDIYVLPAAVPIAQDNVGSVCWNHNYIPHYLYIRSVPG